MSNMTHCSRDTMYTSINIWGSRVLIQNLLHIVSDGLIGEPSTMPQLRAATLQQLEEPPQ